MSDYNIICLSIDSLRRDFLGAYDQPYDWVSDLNVETDNLDRFAKRSAVFDDHFVGSLPCMPARREWQTGIQEFLWRPWGRIESYDTTLPQKARQQDVVTQLITDHFHLFQHGSSGYFEDYHGFEFIRGHEDDAWKTSPYDPDPTLLQQVEYDLDGDTEQSAEDVGGRENIAGDPHNVSAYRPRWAYVRNVELFESEEDFFAPKVFSCAMDWLENNLQWDQWFLRIDEFDVHEPFHCPEPYNSMYTDEDPYDPELSVWPYYGRIDEGQSELTQRELDFVRAQFAGKVTMVDRWFGKLTDTLSELDLWDETIVIVTSDHGHFLGEHGWMGKPTCPDYNVLSQTPLLIWHPESQRMSERISALTSAIDINATILEAFGFDSQRNNHSRSLMPLLRGERETHRDWALYGWWGSSINVTDGQYTYMVPPRPDTPVECYSTSQLSPWGWFTPPSPVTDAESGQFLPYTDAVVWRYTDQPELPHEDPLLFDIDADPRQEENLYERETRETDRMHKLLLDSLDELHAPDSIYERFELHNR